MSSSGGGAAACDRMYSKLIEDGGACVEVNRCPDVRPVRVPPLRWLAVGSGSYRLATLCLAALCAILLITIIAVTTHYKNKPQAGGEASSAAQKQDAEGSALAASIKKLQQEKDQLQKENDELRSQLATATATKAPPKVIVCPTRWLLFNSSCYFISTNPLGWNEAQAHCVTQGAHLAIIHTAEEQTFLWNQLPRGHWMATWFGITDAQTEDQWKWVDGTPLLGGFWEDGEPNNHINEDCGYIVKTLVLSRVAVRSWYDAPCSMSLPFICEKEMG